MEEGQAQRDSICRRWKALQRIDLVTESWLPTSGQGDTLQAWEPTWCQPCFCHQPCGLGTVSLLSEGLERTRDNPREPAVQGAGRGPGDLGGSARSWKGRDPGEPEAQGGDPSIPLLSSPPGIVFRKDLGSNPGLSLIGKSRHLVCVHIVLNNLQGC